MKQPGDRLRSLAARVCSARTMERLIDPVIADMQYEHADAARRGALWRGFWIRLAGCSAFWKGAAMHAIERVKGGMQEWLVRDDLAIGRVLGFIAAATTALVVLDNLTYALGGAKALYEKQADTALALLFLVPQAFPIAISMGVLFGILYAMRLRIVTTGVRRATLAIAFCCTLASFGTLAWVVPASNQAFRVAVSGIPSQALSKGLNELTLRELRWELHRLNGGLMRGSVQARDAAFTYHMRFALSVAPIVSGLLALGLLKVRRLQRSRVALGAVAVMTCVCYYVLMYASRAAVFDGWSVAVVWMPNIVFVVGTLFLVTRTRQASGTV